jgi:glucokinase
MRAVKRKRKSDRGRKASAAKRGRALKNLVIGVDIGGTKIAAGLVDPRTGEIRAQVRMPMAASGKCEEGLAAVSGAIDLLLKNAAIDVREIRAIGLCAPGPLDPRAGVIINPPNVPCWRNFPLAGEIAKAYGVAVKLDNDANAAGLAETIWGAGRGYRNVFYATVGTGIGTGIVLDGRILHGRTGAAGEGGHVSIDYRGPRCACGKRGCIEAFAAGPAIARAAQAELAKRPQDSPILIELAGGKIGAVTSEMVGKAFGRGDRLAKDVLKQTVEYLSFWIGNVIDLLEPEVIIMGGGVSVMLRPFFKELGEGLAQRCENQRASEIPIVAAHFGEDAGIAGAAAICGEAARG